MPENPRIEELRRRVESDPSSIAFAQLGEEYRRAGYYAEAAQTCQTGLARHPGYLSARVTLGRALIELNQLDEAETELDRVLGSASGNLAAIRGMADIYHRRSDLPTALSYYRRALALAQHDPDLEQTVGDIERAVGPGPEPVEVPGGLSFEQASAELMSFMDAMEDLNPPKPEPELIPAVEMLAEIDVQPEISVQPEINVLPETNVLPEIDVLPEFDVVSDVDVFSEVNVLPDVDAVPDEGSLQPAAAEALNLEPATSFLESLESHESAFPSREEEKVELVLPVEEIFAPGHDEAFAQSQEETFLSPEEEVVAPPPDERAKSLPALEAFLNAITGYRQRSGLLS